MMPKRIQNIYQHSSPGEHRAAAFGTDGRAIRVFSERWSGAGGRARFGSVHGARLRTFADDLRGAFCELASGEEAFLRLKSRDGITEGAALCVRIESEARRDKLARVAITDLAPDPQAAFQAWCNELGASDDMAVAEDRDRVAAAFEDALSRSVTLPGGGRMHVDRTRALTAFDIDTAGRTDKGSAGARALAVNRDAVTELARQVSLRGLGGLLVLDCVSPLNAETRDRLRDAAKQAFERFGIVDARTLKPSALGLLEASAPWRYMPVEDAMGAHPSETLLLNLLREVQREAVASPVNFYNLSLCGRVWQAYLTRKTETDAALQAEFGGRVAVVENSTDENKVLLR